MHKNAEGQLRFLWPCVLYTTQNSYQLGSLIILSFSLLLSTINNGKPIRTSPA